MKQLLSRYLLSAATALILCSCGGGQEASPEAGKRLDVLVIGVDGATWNVMRPLMRRGELPNIKRLADTGVTARFKSIRPLFSPAIWTTLATGKLPAGHGIPTFHATRHDLKSSRIWDVVSAAGETVGIFGWLMTWPPDRVNGFIVPSWMAYGPETHPEDLRFINQWGRKNQPLDLEKAKRFGLSERSENSYQRFAERFENIPEDEVMFRYRSMELAVKTDLFAHLYEEYDPRFATYMTSAVDHISHLYWKFHEPEKFEKVENKDIRRFSDCIPSIYREVDRTVGQLVKVAGPDTAVIILSDHGFKALPQHNSREIDVESLLEKLGWANVVYDKLGVRAFLHLSESSITWEEAVSVLEGLQVEESGEKLFNISYDLSTEAVLIETTSEMRDVNLMGNVAIGDQSYPLSEIVPKQPLMSGGHALYGVLIMNGPPFSEGVELEEAHVLDLAPTVMATLGYPVASDLEGKVLLDAFRPEFLEKQPPEIIETYGPPPPVDELEEPARVLPEDQMEKLKSLGYL